MKTLIRSILAALLAVLFTGTALQGQMVLFGADGAGGNPSNLYILNRSDGSVDTVIGQIGFAVTGLAVHPLTGQMYVSVSRNDQTAPGYLISIDKQTGQGSMIGSFGFGSGVKAEELGSLGLIADQTMADITFDPLGNLFGWLEPNDEDLFSINLSTGEATSRGESGLSTEGSGLAFDSTGTLYFAGDDQGNNLHTVDPSDGSASLLRTLFGDGGYGSIKGALAFDENDELYASLKIFTKGDEYLLGRIDTDTGEVTVLGQSVDKLDAIVFDAIPEASTLALVLLGALALVSVYRRK